MRLRAKPEVIIKAIRNTCEEIDVVLEVAWRSVRHGKQEIYPYQAACLYALARSYAQPGARILEIGTYYGYSATILALACPEARIVTLNPHPGEIDEARRVLESYHNVTVLQVTSEAYLEMYDEGGLDFVFVDGDHKKVEQDLAWWRYVKAGGLMLFHDYTPLGAPRHCPPVYRALTRVVEGGRQADVLVIDDQGTGMMGFRKKEGEQWLMQPTPN